MKTIALALSVLTLFGSFPVFPAEAVPDVSAVTADKDYYIAAGDVINISVFPASEFSKEVTVQPDGTIDLPLLGSMKAAGMKPDELKDILTARFSKYVANPSITVSVRKFSSNRVAIIGQITTPGYYEYKEGMRLLDLVAVAGGPQDWAKTGSVRIYRHTVGAASETQDVVPADLEGVLAGDMEKNIPLVNGDIVYIPRKNYSKAAKWITDNFVPWATLFTFGVTAAIVARKN
jgi:polysaccharide export outer membrane protein